MKKDRFKRISIEDVLSHPWICKKNIEVQNERITTDNIDKFEKFTTI
jgi:hypothetical protein